MTSPRSMKPLALKYLLFGHTSFIFITKSNCVVCYCKKKIVLFVLKSALRILYLM